MRIIKRSTCASGKGNVPSYSIGFCVAKTKKGRAMACVTPSTVTWRSSIASSKADWVFGVARLISSVRTICAIIGPARNSNSIVFWLKMLTPVTSLGSISGVNWMRRKVQPMLRAMARANIVLPTPGTSSINRCPSQSSATKVRRTSFCLPIITFWTFSITRLATA